jgi:hypothetical protein
MKRSLLIALVFICSMGYSQVDTSRGYSREGVRAYVERSVKGHMDAYQQREAFRNQVKTLTLTLCFTVIGIALSRTAPKDKKCILLIAFVMVTFLYAMDTSMLDLSNRQSALFHRLDGYLVRFDKMTLAEVDSALVVTDKGIGSSNPWAKISLFFTFRLNDGFWYYLPALISLALFAMLYIHKKEVQAPSIEKKVDSLP